MPNICIIIVNYRTADLTISCLRSLAPAADGSLVRVVVVDNGSNDDSIQKLIAAIEQEGWASWVTLRALDTNGGFAVGNNVVLRAALREISAPEFFWLLNSDTQIRPGALDALVAFMESHPHVGIAGSRLEDEDGTVQRSAFRFPTILGEFENGLRWGIASRVLARWVIAPPAPRVAARTAWVAGASMLVRRAVFETIGLLDEKFFMYFDDVDFCQRAVRANWECWYVPTSRVVHWVGQSSRVTDTRRAAPRRPAYWFAARHHYFLQHHGWLYSALADAAWLCGFGIWRVRCWLEGKPDRDPPQLWRDFIRHSVWFRREPHVSARA